MSIDLLFGSTVLFQVHVCTVILLEAHLLICQIYFGDLLMIVSSFGWGLCWYKLKGCHFRNLWKCTHLDLQTYFGVCQIVKDLIKLQVAPIFLYFCTCWRECRPLTIPTPQNRHFAGDLGHCPSFLSCGSHVPWPDHSREPVVRGHVLSPVFSRLSPPDTESAELRKPRDSQTEAEVHHIWADAIETKVRQGGLLFFLKKKTVLKLT